MKLSKFIKISIAFILILGTVNVYGQFGKKFKRIKEKTNKVIEKTPVSDCIKRLEKLPKIEKRINKAIKGGIPAYNSFKTDLYRYKDYVQKNKESGCLKDDTKYQKKIKAWTIEQKKYEVKEQPGEFIIHAIEENNYDDIDFAVANGVNLNSHVKNGQSPLAIAVNMVNLEMVNLMLEKGADPNFKDKDNRLPLSFSLHANCRDEEKNNRSIKILNSLLEHGADPKQIHRNGLCMAFIKQKKYKELIELDKKGSMQFTIEDYISFYWETPSGNDETDTYFANKIKQGKVGYTYSKDFEEGMKDNLLSEQLLKSANSEKGQPHYTKMKIKSKNWHIVRNDFSGRILHRYIYAYGYGTTKDGVCYVNEVKGVSTYDGSKYGKITYSGFGRRDTVDCE